MNLPPPSLSAEPPRQDSRNLLTRFLKDSETFLETTNFETCRVLLGRRSGHWCEDLSPECTDGCVTLTVPWVELVEVRHLRSATRHLWRDLGPSAYGALCPFLTSTERFQCRMKAHKGSFQFESDPFWIRKGWKVRCADEQRLVAHSSASWSETRIRNWEAAQ